MGTTWAQQYNKGVVIIKLGADYSEMHMIDMISLTKYGLWNDQLHTSMLLWEIHIPNLS